MNKCYDELEPEMVNEDESIFTKGDDVLHSFYCGNFTQGIEEMINYGITPNCLGKYLEDTAEEYGFENTSELYNGHFTLSYMARIGESYAEARLRG